jgi:hypothetical protein
MNKSTRFRRGLSIASARLLAVAASSLTVAILAPAIAAAATKSVHHRPAEGGGSKASAQPPGFPNLGPQASLPAWGQYMKMGLFTPTGQSLADTNTYYGLPHQDTWLDTYLTDASGQTFYLSTHHMVQAGPGYFTTPVTGISLGFMSQSLGLQMVTDPNFKPWIDDQSQDVLADGDVTYFIVDPTTTEQLTFGAKDFTWTSADGNLDVHGTLTAPGNSYYLPSPPPSVFPQSSAFLYGNVYYKVTGDYYGHLVSGYTMIENLWAPQPYDSTYWMTKRMGNWIAWTNTYSNGTTEYGEFFCMNHGYTGAVISNNKGQLLLDSHVVSAKVTETDILGNPLRILYTFGNGERFEYIGNPQHIVLPQAATTSLTDGYMEQLGDTRKREQGDAIQLITGGIPASCETGKAASSSSGTGKLVLGRVKVLADRVRVVLSTGGITVRDIRVIVTRRGRVVASAKLAHLLGSKTVSITARHRLAKGTYTVKATATGIRAVKKRFKVRG